MLRRLVAQGVAEVFPAVFGVNVNISGTVCPALMVRGKVTPAMANCALLLAAEEMVTLPPMALMLVVCVLDVPSATQPKCRNVWAILSCPIVVPVPVKGMFKPAPVIRTLPAVIPAP